ncbi:ACT domain-containing protein, partial [Clostridium perfringens]
TLIISHKDVPGAVSKVPAIVYEPNINIAFMKVFRTERGQAARMVFEMDSPITKDIIDDIKKVEAVEKLVVINPVQEDI